MELKTLGIDLAKKSFQLHGADAQGRTLFRRKLTRSELPLFIANLPRCLIVMESCASAHDWGRKFQTMGHEVRLIAAQFVKPFVQSQKNDRNDAEAIVEASRRPSMRFVAVKQRWQQDLQVLHRGRKRAVVARTALINQVKGLLLEYGVLLEEKSTRFQSRLHEVLEDADNGLSDVIRRVIRQSLLEYEFLNQQIRTFEADLQSLAQQSEDCERLMSVPGVGLLGATAFVAAVGKAEFFRNGRHVGSWLGLVPKQHSTGGVPRLLSITKRGDPALRALLIHGARATLLAMKRKSKQDSLSRWALALLEKKGWSKASVALANKMARIMWHLMKHQETYKMA